MALRFFSSSLETDQRKEIMHKCTLQVSYNAAGVLAHMASDGPEAWTVRQPERSGSLLKITKWLTKIIIGKMEGKISLSGLLSSTAWCERSTGGTSRQAGTSTTDLSLQ